MKKEQEVPIDIIENKVRVDDGICPGVYLLFNGDEVVYVGQGLHPQARIKTHQGSDKVFDSYYIILCNREDLGRIEAENIFNYYPKYNQKISHSLEKYQYVGKVEGVKNGRFAIDVAVIGDNLYLDMTEVGISLIKRAQTLT